MISSINYLAVFLASISMFVLGGIWYAPWLFGKVWQQEAKVEPKSETQGKHPRRVFAVSFIFALIAAFGFALLLGPAPEFTKALQCGLVVGIGLVATSFGINYQFAHRSTKMLLIDGGYHVLQFVIYGLIFALLK